MQVHKQCSLYINVKDQVASLSPVFELHQTKRILQDVLDIKVDYGLMDKTLQKLKKQINLETNKMPLIDEETNRMISDQVEQQAAMNESFRAEITQDIERLNYYVPTDRVGLNSVTGLQPCVCSLLTQICGQFFQSIPTYEDE